MIFNIIYLPIVFIFRDMLFAQAVSGPIMAGVVIGGQIALFIYDRAYDYAQGHIWNKIRGRIPGSYTHLDVYKRQPEGSRIRWPSL